MSPLLRALVRAMVSLAHPKMLLLMVLPLAGAVVIWVVLGVVFWQQAADAINFALATWPSLEGLRVLLDYWPLTLVAAHIALAIFFLLMVPVVLVTTLLIVGTVAMPLVVSHVAARSYPRLEQRQGGDWAGSLWNSLVALFIFLVLAAVTLPLWAFPPLWPVLSTGLLAYLNQRVLRYDALAEHATPEEMQRIIARERWSLFMLGVAVALATHIPVLGFFAPFFGALAFTHYLLERLEALRAAPVMEIEREARRLS
ncbi:MAG TPA: EI24 domain-containing protein [Burkholderiales bacterium]|nr:EI24 domain-containing protein [Burkholderiales bacterium]